MKKNVLMIICHDLGDYLNCYGTPVNTPNLDLLAAQGVVLENHFSTATVCSPARGSIMTGCYPHTHGLMGLVHRGWELDVEKCPAIAMLLGKERYRTAHFGFQHEHWDPYKLGYQEVYKAKSYFCDDVTPVFTDWLKMTKNEVKPFFAHVGFFETHRSGMNPSHFKKENYIPANPSETEVRPCFPDIPEMRQELADFYGCISTMDEHVGKIMTSLKENGLEDNTLVVFTTDHGASFIHAKATVYDGGTKVACIMKLPGKLEPKNRLGQLTSHVDLLPTIFEILGIAAPNYIEGKSILPVLEGVSGQHREFVFSQKDYTNFYDPTRMIRSDRFKYIKKGLRSCIFDFVIPEVESSLTGFMKNKDVYNFYSAHRTFDEFYDLKEDPGELINLIDLEEYRNEIDNLKFELEKHMRSVNDPFIFIRNDLLMPENVYEQIRDDENSIFKK